MKQYLGNMPICICLSFLLIYLLISPNYNKYINTRTINNKTYDGQFTNAYCMQYLCFIKNIACNIYCDSTGILPCSVLCPDPPLLWSPSGVFRSPPCRGNKPLAMGYLWGLDPLAHRARLNLTPAPSSLAVITSSRSHCLPLLPLCPVRRERAREPLLLCTVLDRGWAQVSIRLIRFFHIYIYIATVCIAV